MFCTNCHKIDITTGYCSWVEIHPYLVQERTIRVEFSADDLHLCIELVSMATTYL